MNLKGTQMHQLAALGACLAAMIFVSQAPATNVEDPGLSSRPALEEQSVSWYLTDEYRPFVLPESGANAIVNQRQLELAADQHLQVIPYLSHGILTESDAAALAAQSGVSRSGIPLSAGIPEPGDAVVPGRPELGAFGDSPRDAAAVGSLRDRPDGHQPQLGVSELTVASDGFDWTTTGFAASIIAAMLVALAVTFTRGNRHGYRSA
ncbi:MAG: hypothetical protein MSC30_06800 [Gaiellaceae bacterium MAG52_C11]|nr:hypothetical protein [Candidatus Gaiellasilicea maunaloa]